MTKAILESCHGREHLNPGQSLPNISLHTSGADVGKPLSCALIGEGNLLVECGQLLRISGLRIQGVISDDPLVVRWATGLQIPIIGGGPDGIACLQEPPIDYLFSIDNPRFLSADILCLPRIAAINYHNGPLPRYAGLNAPSWALFNGEKTYGITWHQMDSKIDSGDIVKQHVFAVDSNETALSLNLKCCEECISAFTEILPELARGACVSTPQDSSLRTYCPGARRPPLGGIIDWSRSGEECEALARGLDFGRLFNPLLLPKIWTGTEYLVASEVRLADAAAEALPGTVLAAHGASLTIATQSRPLIIGGLATLDGEPLSCADVVSMHGLHSGFHFPFLEPKYTQRINELSEAVARHEPFWAERLREVLPVSLVRVRRAAELPDACRSHQQLWQVPAELEEWLARNQRWQQGEFLLAAFGGFLARISFEQCFDMEFRDHGVWSDDLPPIFAGRVPFRFQMGDDFEEVLEGVRTEIDRVDRHLTYARDLVPRSPGLRNQLHLRRRDKLPLAVDLGGVGELSGCGHDLVVRLPREGRDGLVVFSQELHTEMPWLMERFSDFIRNLVAGRDASLGRVPFMAEEERQTLLLSWSRTGDADPSSDCLHHLFESQAALSPDAVALQYSSGQLTYRELDAQADAVAVRLLRLGVGPETFVGICLERSPESIVGLLGILKAGGAYVPVDPAHPQDRLAFIMEDCGAKVIVSTRSLASRLPSGPIPRIYLDEEDLPNTSVTTRALTGVTCRNLAYVIYTSGSTGEPKGVMVEHRSVVNFTRAAQARYPMNAGDRLLQFAPITFDASVAEIFTCLASGGTLVIRTDEMLASAEVFFGQCATWEITILDLSTAHWHLLVAQAMESGWPLCPTLRLVIIGGEAVVPAYVDAWRAGMGSHIELINAYGPTETTVAATWVNLDSRAPRDGTPIGKPIPGATAYVLDPFGQLMPIGLVGELHIGGAGLARGYLRRPQLTAEKFVTSPFNDTAEARLYKTGDLCSWRADGMLEFHGRIDGQVKVRGQRIELGEIEAALVNHPDLKACAVVVQDDAEEGKKLTAFVVMRTDEVASLESLRIWAGKRLPGYMIPSRFGILESLPMTSSGKVDRKTLEKLDVVEMASGLSYVAPRSELQCTLVEVWQKILRREQVGIHDNFFELGGHSLMAVVICSKVRHLLDLEIPLRWIFDHPTIEALARQIEHSGRISESFTTMALADRTRPLPMSFGQQRMWMVQQTEPDSATYNQPVAWHLRGPLDADLLRRSLVVIWERHEVLRTALVREGDQLIQAICGPDALKFPWTEVDFSLLPEPERTLAAGRRMEEEARRPFDLAQAPLWRALLLTIGEEDHRLMVVFHHSVIDEWSVDLFLGELTRLYEAHADCEAAGLAGLPVQYADFAAWQRERLAGALLERSRGYWSSQLREMPPPLQLPGDHLENAPRIGRGATHHFELPAEVAVALRGLARQEEMSLFGLVLAGFQTWLFRWTGHSDVVVGSPVANRERSEVQALMGFFLNTLPLRARLDAETSFRGLLGQVRQTVSEGLEHATLPFEQMVKIAAEGRDGSRQPLYQVMFVLLEQGVSALSMAGLESQQVHIGTGTSKSDLVLSVLTEGPVWACDLEYSTHLFSAECAGQMAAHLVELFHSIAGNPDEAIGRLNLLPAAERQRVLVEWNRTERDYPRDKCVHELFEEQVERTPDAVAVEFEGQTSTYQELNRRANHLAHILRSEGVGRGKLVALCVERSIEMLVGLLGILKSGGAYVPLDPEYPEARLKFILQDTAAPVVVTREQWHGKFADLGATRAEGSGAPGMRVVCLDVEAGAPAGGNDPNPDHTISAEDPAYVIYTSGSTGEPKGVIVPHRGVIRLITNTDYVSLGPDDTILHAAPLSFDASTFELWGALLNGGRLVLMPPGRPSLADIGEAIRRHKVTTLWLTAGLFHLMVEERLEDLKSLRQLLAGGDVLSPKHVKEALRGLPGCRLINGYGPTENTTFTCCHTITGEQDLEPNVPIGRPIANTRVYVLDSQLHPVPVGVAGELFTGGDGVAIGYLNQQQLTAGRFIPDPFQPGQGARLYRTGDRVRWRRDGTIEFLGRLDQQVKIRGFRIEAGEIEAVLATNMDVAACAVVAQGQSAETRFLTAFVVARAGVALNTDLLRTWLGERLPDYMVPSRFAVVESLPLTPNGKLDRKALAEVESAGQAVTDDYLAPRTELERQLAVLWEKAFSREHIGVRDNFFSIGGHSMQAVRLAADIEKLLGHKLPIGVMFQAPTIELLACWLENQDWIPAWSSLVPLQTQGSKPPVFFVHGSGGGVYVYLKLAKLLPPDQPCYGIQPVGVDGRRSRHTTVRQMAVHYAEEILSFQSEGPVFLSGYSMGGLIAFEVAQEVWRRGRRVALLALLDSDPLGPVPWRIYCRMQGPRIWKRFWIHLGNWWKLPLHGRMEYVKGRFNALRRLAALNDDKPPPVTVPPEAGSDPPQVPGYNDYYQALAYTHRVFRYPGSIDVIVSDSTDPQSAKVWNHLARGGACYHPVPGRHLEIIEPEYMPKLAKAMAEVLARAQEKEAS